MEQEATMYWKIFVAEESSQQLSLLQQYARRMPDMKITGAFLDGKTLLRALENGERPDALILNLCLMDMDALELLNRLQVLPQAYRLKILVTSGGRNQNVHERLLSLGADYYMIKPYSMETLFERLRLICQDNLNAKVKLEDLIHTRLQQFGVLPGEDQGYMQRALYKAALAPQPVRVVEDIYSAVARESGVSLGAVDASLRRTLKEIERVGTPEYRQLFQLPQSKGKKMTVGLFLNVVGQQLHREHSMLKMTGDPGPGASSEEVEQNGAQGG